MDRVILWVPYKVASIYRLFLLPQPFLLFSQQMLNLVKVAAEAVARHIRFAAIPKLKSKKVAGMTYCKTVIQHRRNLEKFATLI